MKKKRIYVAKIKIDYLNKSFLKCDPYGYVDCQLIYNELMYWEDVLYKLKK
jgi:hypothetical protein